MMLIGRGAATHSTSYGYVRSTFLANRKMQRLQAQQVGNVALNGGGIQQLFLTVLNLRMDPVGCLLAVDLEVSSPFYDSATKPSKDLSQLRLQACILAFHKFLFQSKSFASLRFIPPDNINMGPSWQIAQALMPLLRM